jgi:hypothetical protein
MDEPRINAIASAAPSVFASGRPAAFLGVLTLDTQFPRLPGDIGNPASFGVPVLTRTVRDTRPQQAVQSAAGQRAADLFTPFCRAMHDLERMGAAAITTSCGFLVLMQERLQAQATVPVVTSSLMMLPGLLDKHARVGVLTVSARHLSQEFLAAAGVPASRMDDVVIEGVDAAGEFARAMLENRPSFDFGRARRDVLEAARRLAARDARLTDVVLECTNMPPYAGEIARATGLKCWSLLQSEVLLAPLRR